MNKLFQINPIWRMALLLVVCMVCAGAGQAAAAVPDAGSAALLRARYGQLEGELSHNQFKRPLYLESVESPSHLTGDIYALVAYPFATVNAALDNPAHWCDVLTLHLNIKYCHASTEAASSILMVSIGTKYDRPLSEAYPVKFIYSVAAVTPEYFGVRLYAKTGPLNTSDYHIQLEAVSVPDGKTFVHLTYSYAYSFAGRLAMQGYLATVGRDKVGFTDAGKQAGSQPIFIGGVRGLIERNTMRYYLAIDAYLAAFSAPPPAQLDMRLQNWFTSTELYHRQLHEMDRAAYLDMKRSEYLRQQKAQ